MGSHLAFHKLAWQQAFNFVGARQSAKRLQVADLPSPKTEHEKNLSCVLSFWIDSTMSVLDKIENKINATKICTSYNVTFMLRSESW